MLVGHALAGIRNSLWPIFVLLLPTTVCCVMVVSGWQRWRRIMRLPQQSDLAQRSQAGRASFASGLTDIAAELDAVLRQFGARAAGQFTTLEIAVPAGLGGRIDADVFRAVLSDLVGGAIARTPCGRVLVSAARTGHGFVQADGPRHQASLRDAERLAAMRGVIVHVDVRPSEGTTVSYVLPTQDGAGSARSVGEPVDSFQVWTATNSVQDAHNGTQLRCDRSVRCHG